MDEKNQSDLVQGGDTVLSKLELPKMDLRSIFKHFGPGMILMMTGIGTSHLVSAPTAGGRYEFALLWCITVSYVFKYYGFEMAFRFTNATGRSIMDAYGTAPGKWPLWYVMIVTLIQCAVGEAGRLIATAAVMYWLFSVYMGLPIPLWVYGMLVAVFSAWIILQGKYGAVEIVTKICAGALVISAVLVYLYKPAPASAYAHFFIFQTPHGSWIIIAAFLGLLPTGIDVSLQASEWGKAKRVGMGKIRDYLEEKGIVKKFDPFTSTKEDLTVDIEKLPEHAQEYCRRWFKIGLWDFRTGHVISAIMASIFLLLAAVWMYPSPVHGKAVMGEIAKIFTKSVGPWMMALFIAGALAATFSTAFNYIDGWPRVVAACCRNIFKSTASLAGTAPQDLTPEKKSKWYSEYNIYRIVMFYTVISSILIVAGLPKPVWLVLVASALAYFIAPVIFFLNLYYVHTVIPKKDKLFYPSTFGSWFAWGSLAIFTIFTGVMIAARLFHIPILGA